MYNDSFEHLYKMNKNLTGPLGDLGKTVTEIGRRQFEQHLEMISDHFAQVSDQLKRLSTVKKPDDLINIQRECLNETISTSVANFNKLVQLQMENMEQCAKIFTALRDPIVRAAEKAVDKTVDKVHRAEKETVK